MQKALLAVSLTGIACAMILSADWASTSGNPQRDGWARGEGKLSKDAAMKGEIKLAYRYRLEPSGTQTLTSPVVLSNIIGWKGFKELAFVAGGSDNVYSFDSAMGRTYFKTKLGDNKLAAGTALCPAGLTAAVSLNGGSGGGRGPAPPPAAGRGASGRGGAPFAGAPGGSGRGPVGPPPGGGGFGGGGAFVWAVGSDGNLYTLRRQDGDAKATPPAKFLPPNSKVSGLAVAGGVIYAATEDGCGGAPNALYAITISDKMVVSFPTNGSGFAGSGSVAVSSDSSTLYGLIASGKGDVAGPYNNTVVALGSRDLTVKDYFTPSAPVAWKAGSEVPGTTPAVFAWNGKDYIVSGGTDGRLYLLDSLSLGGADHHTPLSQSEVIAGSEGMWGTLATWEDANNGNTRWIYASVTGASPAKFPATNGAASGGSIVAFKVIDQGGKPSLSPQWSSRDLVAPAPPAIANGLVFALSSGSARSGKNAVLYALDAQTGKELWSSGTQVTTTATTGLAVNVGRVYFGARDNSIYAFGIPIIFEP